MNADPPYQLKLYIAGRAQNSVEALANLADICRVSLQDRHSLEVIDVLKEPARALADHIFMTPTLVRVLPFPVCKIVGTLSDANTVRRALDLDPIAA